MSSSEIIRSLYTPKPLPDEGLSVLQEPKESLLFLQTMQDLFPDTPFFSDPSSLSFFKDKDDLDVEEVRNENTTQLEIEGWRRYFASWPYHRFYGSILGSQPDLHPELKGNQFFHMLDLMVEDMQRFLNEEKEQISPSNQEYFQTCIGKLKKLREKLEVDGYSEDIDAIRKAIAQSTNSDQEFLNKNLPAIMEEIKNLPVGDSCLLPGGSWKHAAFCEIKRIDEGSYLLTLINTGDDEPHSETRHPMEQWFNFHPFAHHLYRHSFQSDRYAHKTYTLKADRLDEACLRQMLSPAARGNLPASLRIQELDKLLINERGALPGYGRLHHAQKRGNCAVKCLSCWLKGALIERFGEIEGRALYEQFNTYRTEKIMREIKQLDRDNGLAKLKYIYRVKTEEEVEEQIKIRDLAAFEVLERRTAKAAKYRALCQ